MSQKILTEIYQPISKDLADVDAHIREHLSRTHHEAISDINRFLLKSPGKKLRPALVLLSFKALDAPYRDGLSRKDLIAAASSIELLHIASLVHDDVIDNAAYRHKQESINAKWGDEVSILLGDFLYSLACESIAATGDAELFKCISAGAKYMCEGELSQVCDRGNFDLNRREYLTMIEQKTASLFSSASLAGALIADCDKKLHLSMKNFGRYFGTAFQIIDDYLDIVSTEEKLGKIPGQDILSGELTLPVMLLYEVVGHSRKKELIKRLKLADGEVFDILKSEILATDVVKMTEEIILSYIENAERELAGVPEGSCKNSLKTLLDFSVSKVREYSCK